MNDERFEIEATDYYKYALDIVQGRINSCLYIKQACDRFLNDLKREDIYFDYKKVEKVIKFISVLKLYEGEFAGNPFILRPFQAFIIANIFGWYRKEDNRRRYNQVYVEMARKSAKSTLAAAISLCLFLIDGEAAPQITVCANSRQQGHLLFDMIDKFAKQLDPKKKTLKQLRDTIKCKVNQGYLEVISADASTGDGKNLHAFVYDEYHASPDSKLYDVLKSSQGARKNPVAIVITTAGFTVGGVCHQMHNTLTEILAGVKEDDSFFGMIYTLDEDDDVEDEDNWIKCQPNLDFSVSRKFMRDQVRAMKNNPSEYVSTMTKIFNKWMMTKEVWIPDNYLLPCMQEEVDLTKFKDNEDAFVTCGTDFSAVADLTALAYVVVDEDNIVHAKIKYYLPQTALTESPNREMYKRWALQGYLTVSEGNVTDLDLINNDLMKTNEYLYIQKIFYDSWMSLTWSVKATELGLPIEPCSQAIGNFSKGTKEVERLVREGRIKIDNNPITLWMFRNCVLKYDTTGNCKPSKEYCTSEKKIDGIIALIEGVMAALGRLRYSNEISII